MTQLQLSEMEWQILGRCTCLTDYFICPSEYLIWVIMSNFQFWYHMKALIIIL